MALSLKAAGGEGFIINMKHFLGSTTNTKGKLLTFCSLFHPDQLVTKEKISPLS